MCENFYGDNQKRKNTKRIKKGCPRGQGRPRPLVRAHRTTNQYKKAVDWTRYSGRWVRGVSGISTGGGAVGEGGGALTRGPDQALDGGAGRPRGGDGVERLIGIRVRPHPSQHTPRSIPHEGEAISANTCTRWPPNVSDHQVTPRPERKKLSVATRITRTR